MSPTQWEDGTRAFSLPTPTWAVVASRSLTGLELRQFLVLGADTETDENGIGTWVFHDDELQPGACTLAYLKGQGTFEAVVGFYYGPRLDGEAFASEWAGRARQALADPEQVGEAAL